MIHVGGDRLQRGIRRVLSDGVDRNAVCGDANLIREKRLVVARVEPRQNSFDEVRVELHGVFKGGDSFGGVEDDVVAVVDHFAAVGPQAPMSPTVGISRGVAEREARGFAHFFRPLAQFEEPSGVLGELLEAGGAHGADHGS